VTITGLTPSTEYEYRVQGDGSTWSTVYTAKTAPPPGPADFDAIYVADTGLVGREDGLATGTQQVVDEIAALSPDVVLLGGDYAYYNTDKRYGTLDATIDAWFNQMQPIGSRSPMMPTYGNHEVLLDEGFEFWAPRFATPTGFDGRRFYSFDVGDVHFVSLLAVTETNGLSSSALAWIEDDIEAAKAAGQRWIVPFFHVSPFSDGSSHPSNLALREQLGPLFERLGVQIAIASHDQSYERTFPLVDVPATNTPTSTGKRCYTMDDGVTWVKVSPGGKLSNKNGEFSQWRTEPPPAWTAFRDNTMHHFSRLVVSAEGTMRMDTYGVVGDGSPPVIVDTFEYRESCPAELVLGKDELQFGAVAGEDAADQTVSLSAADGSAASFAVEVDAPWLEVTPTAGGTPTDLTVGVDTTGLAAGLYSGVIRATADGYVTDAVRVTLAVRDLVVSTSPDRSSPISLEGASVAGNIYVFTTPDPGVQRVRFWLDNPTMSGTPRKTESNGPFDFAGTATNGSANPFNTSTVSNDTHSITAALDLVDGSTQVVTRSFVVSNP
ncbi:MAG: metallophosphoesterase, partial [Haloechinothrix sp.]